jgi:cyanophycinase
LSVTPSAHTAEVGPEKGALLIIGGGRMSREMVTRFIELAGGTNAHFIVIPTAEPENDFSGWNGDRFLRNAGATNITLLHTRSREEANREEFVAPIRKANAIWFGGGRQWRFVDSYLGTLAEKEFHKVLERGGVIGGSSAGATIQGSYLVRGAREGNHIMMAAGYEQGFGFLKNSAVDQHWLARKREKDLIPVIEKHQQLLGVGIDEDTAILVIKDQAEVIGRSKVAFYFRELKDTPYVMLEPGQKFDLKRRTIIQQTTEAASATSNQAP